MKEKRFIVTMRDIQRYRILKDCVEKRIKATQASHILGLSYIHTLRLKKRVLKGGLEGLLRITRPSARRIPKETVRKICYLFREHYWDFNILHFKDKLGEIHNLQLSYESIRKILIMEGIHHPKKKKKVYRRRRRMPKAGMLVQMDSSEHRWLESIPERWHLIAMIDDASNEVPYARFFPKDTVFGNMYVIRRFVELKGIFSCLYVDKASHFTTSRHSGIYYSISPEQDETQIERALKELNINIITANSPQAKGRIERLFSLFQDRLVKEMRLAGIKDYEQASRFLVKKFLPFYNKRFSRKVESSYFPLPKNTDLDTVFSKKYERIVKADNTIQVMSQTIQIPPTPTRFSFRKAKVDVCVLESGRVLVMYKGEVICESQLSENNRTVEKKRNIEEFLDAREYVTCSS